MSTDPSSAWMCGAFQPVKPPLWPYRCTEPHGHAGPHRAALLDDEIVAEWTANPKVANHAD